VEEEAQVIEYSRVSIRNMNLLIKEGFFQQVFNHGFWLENVHTIICKKAI